MELCDLVYPHALKLPDVERFGLATQIRRAASSVPMNVAEGYGAGTRPMFLKHLRIARGSLAELDTALEIGARVWEVKPEGPALQLLAETDRVIQALIRGIENSPKPPPGMTDG